MHPLISGSISPWFIARIETFAPPEWREERHRLYDELAGLQAGVDTPVQDQICLFVLAQVVAAQRLATGAGEKGRRRGASAHETWYGKERQRIAKLLRQIDESPIVSGFRAQVSYYDPEDVTCPHGRNQKTCDELYAHGFTLRLLERYPAQSGARKQVERVRNLEAHLPALQDLCEPSDPEKTDPAVVDVRSAPLSGVGSEDCAAYLLGTVVSRLRQAGLTVAQSCGVVDRVLSWCFGQLDPDGTRPAQLAEHWRRLC